MAMSLEALTDTAYRVEPGGVCVITISRPERMNSFRGRTIDELIFLFRTAWVDRAVGAIVLTGAGERAFCAGGDQKQRAETGDYGPTESGMFEVERLHRLIREVPKPVIAAVNGFAIGGGHVMHVLCDLTIAADTRGSARPARVSGSFDAGFGTAYLARVVGEKRARADLVPAASSTTRRPPSGGGSSTRSSRPRTLMATAIAWGRQDREALPHGAALSQALLQRRHRSHRRAPAPRLRRSRALRPDGRGSRGLHRLQREARPRLLAVPWLTPAGRSSSAALLSRRGSASWPGYPTSDWPPSPTRLPGRERRCAR